MLAKFTYNYYYNKKVYRKLMFQGHPNDKLLTKIMKREPQYKNQHQAIHHLQKEN